jgi:polysaccharide deacetylase family protein (PEP-CTERM system associated)
MTTDFFKQQAFEPADLGAQASGPIHAFTVDVEEWYQVGAFEHTLSRDEWETLESRVVQQTHTILSLLEEAKTQATFFCLGWVAKRNPALIKAIADAGHEVACHGMDHQRLFTMNREEFRADIRESKKLLEQASGQSVIGYRAPSFSLTPDVWWVYEELDAEGFRYSSSLYPVVTDHYGSNAAPRVPFHPFDGAAVLEVPLTVADTAVRRFPASGGGYFRLLPYMVSSWLFGRAFHQTGVPCVFYMHPWEVDPEQPYVSQAPLKSRLRHYTAQKKLPHKLRKLLAAKTWGRMDQIYADALIETPEANK